MSVLPEPAMSLQDPAEDVIVDVGRFSDNDFDLEAGKDCQSENVSTDVSEQPENTAELPKVPENSNGVADVGLAKDRILDQILKFVVAIKDWAHLFVIRAKLYQNEGEDILAGKPRNEGHTFLYVDSLLMCSVAVMVSMIGTLLVLQGAGGIGTSIFAAAVSGSILWMNCPDPHWDSDSMSYDHLVYSQPSFEKTNHIFVRSVALALCLYSAAWPEAHLSLALVGRVAAILMLITFVASCYSFCGKRCLQKTDFVASAERVVEKRCKKIAKAETAELKSVEQPKARAGDADARSLSHLAVVSSQAFNMLQMLGLSSELQLSLSLFALDVPVFSFFTFHWPLLYMNTDVDVESEDYEYLSMALRVIAPLLLLWSWVIQYRYGDNFKSCFCRQCGPWLVVLGVLLSWSRGSFWYGYLFCFVLVFAFAPIVISMLVKLIMRRPYLKADKVEEFNRMSLKFDSRVLLIFYGASYLGPLRVLASLYIWALNDYDEYGPGQYDDARRLEHAGGRNSMNMTYGQYEYYYEDEYEHNSASDCIGIFSGILFAAMIAIPLILTFFDRFPDFPNPINEKARDRLNDFFQKSSLLKVTGVLLVLSLLLLWSISVNREFVVAGVLFVSLPLILMYLWNFFNEHKLGMEDPFKESRRLVAASLPLERAIAMCIVIIGRRWQPEMQLGLFFSVVMFFLLLLLFTKPYEDRNAFFDDLVLRCSVAIVVAVAVDARFEYGSSGPREAAAAGVVLAAIIWVIIALKPIQIPRAFFAHMQTVNLQRRLFKAIDNADSMLALECFLKLGLNGIGNTHRPEVSVKKSLITVLGDAPMKDLPAEGQQAFFDAVLLFNADEDMLVTSAAGTAMTRIASNLGAAAPGNQTVVNLLVDIAVNISWLKWQHGNESESAINLDMAMSAVQALGVVALPEDETVIEALLVLLTRINQQWGVVVIDRIVVVLGKVAGKGNPTVIEKLLVLKDDWQKDQYIRANALRALQSLASQGDPKVVHALLQDVQTYGSSGRSEDLAPDDVPNDLKRLCIETLAQVALPGDQTVIDELSLWAEFIQAHQQ